MNSGQTGRGLVLVFGGTGMLGTIFVQMLLSRGFIVDLVVSGKSSGGRVQAGVRNIFEINLAKQISCEAFSLYFPRKPSYSAIFYLAAKIDMAFCETCPEIASLVNAEYFGLVKKIFSGVRAIYVSTDAVLGLADNRLESAQCAPTNVYGKTKLAGEAFIVPDQDAVVRMCLVGVQKPNFVNWVLVNLYDGKKIHVYCDQMFSPVDVLSASEFLVSLIESKRDAHGVIHLASDQCISKFKFAMELAAKMNLDLSLIHSVSIDTCGWNDSVERPKNQCLGVSLDRFSKAVPLDRVIENLKSCWESSH